MTMPIKATARNSRKREVNAVQGIYQKPGNNRIVQTQTQTRAVFGLRSNINTNT